jgi:hypothetical protein
VAPAPTTLASTFPMAQAPILVFNMDRFLKSKNRNILVHFPVLCLAPGIHFDVAPAPTLLYRNTQFF